MFRILSILVICFSAASANAANYRDKSVPIAAVPALDLDRYLGRWFEIARYPFKWEDGCYSVTADYAKKPDGSIQVINSCNKGSVNGEKVTYEGEAWITEPGKLRVSFVNVPLLKGLASGDYWVLYIDPSYTVAVIGSPKGSTGWILARKSKITNAQKERALKALRDNGYDTSKLIYTEH